MKVFAYIYFTLDVPASLCFGRTLRQVPPIRFHHSLFVMSRIVVRKYVNMYGVAIPVFTLLALSAAALSGIFVFTTLYPGDTGQLAFALQCPFNVPWHVVTRTLGLTKGKPKNIIARIVALVRVIPRTHITTNMTCSSCARFCQSQKPTPAPRPKSLM